MISVPKFAKDHSRASLQSYEEIAGVLGPILSFSPILKMFNLSTLKKKYFLGRDPSVLNLKAKRETSKSGLVMLDSLYGQWREIVLS